MSLLKIEKFVQYSRLSGDQLRANKIFSSPTELKIIKKQSSHLNIPTEKLKFGMTNLRKY